MKYYLPVRLFQDMELKVLPGLSPPNFLKFKVEQFFPNRKKHQLHLPNKQTTTEHSVHSSECSRT
jgi:hypothetical protein